MFETDDFWRAIVCVTAFVCVTFVSVQMRSVGVLWWYIVPLLIWGI